VRFKRFKVTTEEKGRNASIKKPALESWFSMFQSDKGGERQSLKKFNTLRLPSQKWRVNPSSD
jgi:hypothetical protein